MDSFSDILLQGAKKYHTLGLAIHPLGYGGKNPLIEDWSNPPKLTVDDLALCFGRRADVITGLGFCGGAMSGGVCVLDFDSDWQNSLDNFLYSWSELANTALWSTAHGRRQMGIKILNLPDSQTVTKFQRQSAIIELRCNSANNVLPPSFHAHCNKPYCVGDSWYEWVSDQDTIEFLEVDYNALLTWLKDWGQVIEDAPKQAIEENPVDIGTLDKLLAAQEAPRAVKTAQKMIQDAQDGYKHSMLLRAAGLLGGYVAAGGLTHAAAVDILREEIDAKPNVDDYKLAYRTIENGLTWGIKRPFTADKILTDKAEFAQRQNGGTVVNIPTIQVISTAELEKMDLGGIGINLDDLMTTDYPEPVWIIQDLLPIGLVFFAGKPKVGKSWLTLQMAGAIAKGASFFSFTPPYKIPKIAIFALEDRPKRLKDRIAKQGWYRPGLPVKFFTAADFKTIAGDLRSPQARDNLMLFLKKEKFGLAIIDTISRACFVDQLKNDVMAEILDPFQSFAQNENICIEFVDHHSSKTKGETNGPLGDIMGATQKGGIADVAFGLYRVDGLDGKFSAVGRDIDEMDVAARFNKVTGLWEYQGDFNTFKRSTAQQKYIEALEEHGSLTIAALADCVGVSYEGARKTVNALHSEGLIQRVIQHGRIVYAPLSTKL